MWPSRSVKFGYIEGHLGLIAQVLFLGSESGSGFSPESDMLWNNCLRFFSSYLTYTVKMKF